MVMATEAETAREVRLDIQRHSCRCGGESDRLPFENQLSEIQPSYDTGIAKECPNKRRVCAPSPANPSTVTIPVTKDDLDMPRAQLPPRVHIAARKR
jgi:hypothetical protein